MIHVTRRQWAQGVTRAQPPMRGLRYCARCRQPECYICGDMCDNADCVLHSVAESMMGKIVARSKMVGILMSLLVDMCEMVPMYLGSQNVFEVEKIWGHKR